MALREVRLPALTTTMDEAELVAWQVDVGDHVREGQPLGEVITDKVDMELESPVEGTVRELRVDAGATVAVGAVVAVIDTESDDLLGGLGLDGDAAAGDDEGGAGGGAGGAGDLPGAGRMADAGDAGAPRAGSPRVPAPPPVRIRARQAGIDLADVTPTGRRGQVTTEDLRRYMERRAAQRPTAGAGARAAATGEAADAVGAGGGAGVEEAAAARRRAAVRAATARVVTRSAAIPQFTLHRAIDLTRAVQQKAGRSWTTEIVRALAAALRTHPELNGHWDEAEQRVHPSDAVRIGLAVDTPAGLVVVGIDDPDRITPAHADEHVREIAGRARAGQLRASDVEGITFTVSNLGGMGVDAFDALVMPPQAGILSVGRVAERPAVVDGRVRPRLQVDVGLTIDHRVADGADGARLLETFAANLEAA